MSTYRSAAACSTACCAFLLRVRPRAFFTPPPLFTSQSRDAASTIVTCDRKQFLFTEGSLWPSCYTGYGLVLPSVPGSRCYHGLLHWGLPLVVFLPSAAH